MQMSHGKNYAKKKKKRYAKNCTPFSVLLKN